MTDPTRWPVYRPDPSGDITAHFEGTAYGTPRPPLPPYAGPGERTQQINPDHRPRHFAPEPPPAPPVKRPARWPAFVIAFAAVLLVLGATGYAMVSRNMIALPGHALEDSGVAACRVLAASDDGNPAAEPSASTKASFEKDAETREALARMRKMFSSSHFDDIKNNGVALMDIAAQLFTGDSSGGMALLSASNFITLYAGLAGACGAQGVPLPPLST